jgi:hypothetical protein
MWFCFKWMSHLMRFARKNPGFELLGNMGYAQMLSIVAFAATSAFSSVAYQYFYPALAGMCVALYRSAQREAAARGLKIGDETPRTVPAIQMPPVKPRPVRTPALAPSPAGGPFPVRKRLLGR